METTGVTETAGADLGVLADARFVMDRATHVALDPAAAEGLAERLLGVPVPGWDDRRHFTDGGPRTANYLLLLDSLNFSFWAPPGEARWGIDYGGEALRGYWALAAALKRGIEEGTPLDDAACLAEITPEALARVLRGRGEIPLFETRLEHCRRVGRRLLEAYGGQFAHAVMGCGGSAVALARLLAAEFPGFDDVATYAGRPIRLYKRAQILPADLYGAFGGEGLGAFHDLDRLTAFADYKVPQVLEREGVLRYAPALEARLRAFEEIPAGAPEEVELRAATVVGAEAVRAALAAKGRPLTAVEVDWVLWEAGLVTAPDDLPYHHTRTVYY